VWAAEAALLAELEERDTAHGACALIEAGKLLGCLTHGQMLRQQTGHGGQHLRRLVR
jgi:hypothetical protein